MEVFLKKFLLSIIIFYYKLVSINLVVELRYVLNSLCVVVFIFFLLKNVREGKVLYKLSCKLVKNLVRYILFYWFVLGRLF